MKKIHYEQMICASTQKSIINNMPGFGVRTKSSGISPDEADELYMKSGVNYGLPVNQMASEQTVVEHPHLDELYPSLYTYCRVKLSNGSVRYVIARTLYIGMEYGFFADIPTARRAGSNYLAHLYVFDEQPPLSVLSNLVSNNGFLPADKICSPDNDELCGFLIGEPIPLRDGTFDVDETNSSLCSINEDAGWLAIALLQAYKNTREDNPFTIKNVLIKLNHARVPQLLIALGQMPLELTENIFFQANSLQYSGVPEGFRMLIINEKQTEPSDDEFHITVDLLDEQSMTNNIENNYLYDQILQCSKENDFEMFSLNIQLFLELSEKQDIDIACAYTKTLLTKTTKDIKIGQLSVELLRKLSLLSLSNKDEDVLWDKVNKAVNDVFSVPCLVGEVRSALEIVDFLNQEHNHRLAVNTRSGEFIVNLLFNKENMLNEIVGDSHEILGGALCLMKHAVDTLPEEKHFYDVLKTSSNRELWEKIIRLYYGSQLSSKFSVVIANVMESDVCGKVELANSLYPLNQFCSDWFVLVDENPSVAEICKNSVTDYLIQQMNDSPQDMMGLYFSINEKSRGVLNTAELLAAYLEAIENTSAQIDVELLNRIMQSASVPIDVKKRCETLLAIADSRPLSIVNASQIRVVKNKSQNKEYVLDVLKEWLQTAPAKQEVYELSFSDATNEGDISKLLEILWAYLPSQQKIDTLWFVTDKLRHRNIDMRRIINNLTEETLKEELIQQDRPWQRIKHKGTAFFKNIMSHKK